MNRRVWYLVALMLLGAACQGASRFGPPYKPSDPNSLAVDSTQTRANPHHKEEP